MRLNRQQKAYAVLQDGIITLANNSFISKLGYTSPDEIENNTLLDLAENLDKDSLRLFLHVVANTPKNPKEPPKLSLIFKKSDGSTLVAEMYAYPTKFDGEMAVEIYLVTADDLKLSKKIINLPWKLYLSFLCIIAISILPNTLLPNLNINNAPTTFLPPDAPSVVLNNQVREIFPSDEVFVLLFEGVALFSDGFLIAYDELTEQLESHEQVSDVISITRQDHISGSEDGFLVEPLVNIDELEDSRPKERLARAVSDRFALNSLVSEDGSAIAIVIIPKTLNNSIRNLALEEDILRLVKELRLDGYLKAMAGEITTDVAQMRMVLRDNMIFIPVTVVIGLLLTWMLFHRIIAVITTGVVTGAVVNSTIAFYVIFQQPFNSISSIIPPLLSALTIAALVHFYNALHYASKRGLAGKERVDAALKEIKRPALFSALTTSAGLASLGLSPIPPISTFGLTSAAGVFLIYLIVIYILPPIFSHFDHQEWSRKKVRLPLIDRAVSLLFHFSIRKPVVVIGLFTVLLGIGIPHIAKVDVETNLHEFFPQNHTLRKDIAQIEHKLVGTMPMDIIFKTHTDKEIIQPEFLKELQSFQYWAENLPTVDKSLSLADFIEEMHWGFNNEEERFRSIPKQAEIISQYLFIYDGEDIYDFVDEDFQTTRVTLNVNVHGTNEISALMEGIEEYLGSRSLLNNTSFEIAGYSHILSEQEDLMVGGLINSLVGAVALIFILMIAQWRSFKDAIICMVPNLSPIILIFILMGVLGIWLDMATAMIASVAVGIAIDDTIHVYHGFISRVRMGVTPVLALTRTYRLAGKAVVITTIILCSQFLVLMLGQFVPITNFGLLTCAGLLAALLFDLMLLPAILILVFRKKSSPQSN